LHPKKGCGNLGESVGEDKKLVAKDYSKDEIIEDKTVEDKVDLQVAEK